MASNKNSSIQIDSGDNAASPNKNKSNAAADDSNLVANTVIIIAPVVMQFLGVQSLLRFSATNQKIHGFLGREVARRKARVAECEATVKTLLVEPAMPLRANVLLARQLYLEVREWIDNELNWQDRMDDDGFDHLPMATDKLFTEERKYIKTAGYGRGALSTTKMPLCFYVPPEGEMVVLPSDELIAKMRSLAIWVWYAEDHMGDYHANSA